MRYNKPFSELIVTEKFCEYGCNTTAYYKFRNNKLCCSIHYNSCPGKIKTFSDLDHTERTAKSLHTRIRMGITKSSQIKAGKSRRDSGHYDRLSSKMQSHWIDHPWQNNTHCLLLPYKTSGINFQGTYEYKFLEMLEELHGLEWIIENVKRGPSLWYNDPITDREKLYISDFIIDNTIYEIKSAWTWNKIGKDSNLENKNMAKLSAAREQGFNTVLVLDGKEIYERIMD